MKNVKKAISLLLSLMLVLGTISVVGLTASAADISLNVGGVSVTDDNKDDVLGDGTVSYDFFSRTLTLNNANITTSGNAIYASGSIEQSSNLTIILKGKNYLNGGRNALYTLSVDTVIDGSQGGTLKAEGVIYTPDAPLTIQNVSNLEVRGRVFCPINPELNAPYSLKIKDSMVAVESDDTEAIYTTDKPLIISGSSIVMAQASDSAMYFTGGMTLEDGLSLSYPEGGTVSPIYILNPDGTDAKRAVIGNGYFIDPESNPTAGGTVSGGGLYNSGSAATVTATPATGYRFVNWTENGNEVSTDAEYSFTVTGHRELVANFERVYTVKFVNEDGTELQSRSVAYGETPVYTGETPTKEQSDQYVYTFAGWSPEITSVTTDATYTATFTQAPRKYEIKFVNEDGTELQSSTVIYGGTPAYTGEMPTKEATAEYTYSFLAWTPSLVPVTTDATYTATFTQAPREYEIKFVNEDGSELQKSDVAYGETPVYTGETPTKEQSDQYVYTFGGWSPEITGVTGEATYTATFTQAPRKYEIKFVNEDGTELQSGDVAYGETPKYTGETPTKTATAEYTYEFKGWSPEISQVSGEATYTATYTETPVDYTLKFCVDGEVYKESTVPFGTETSKPDDPVKDGYTFKWVDQIPETMPAQDVTINGEFTAIEYTATFVDENGETVEKVTFTVKDESITEPEVPAKEGYTGKWEEYKLTPGGITVKPVYTEIPADEPKVPEEETPEEPAEPVTVNGNRSVNLGYKENQTFTADTGDLPEGAEVHWFVNGEDVGTGSEYTIVGPKDDYTIQVKVIDKDGNVIYEGEEQTVEVKNGFLDKVMFFFAYLLKILLYPYFMLGIL